MAKRDRVDKDDPDALLGLVKTWRTGTSKRYWALRAEGRCEEALKLIRAAARNHDAEALFELAEVHRWDELGVERSSIVCGQYVRKAAKLGHPRAVILRLDYETVEYARDNRQAIGLFIEACDDYLAKWHWFTELDSASFERRDRVSWGRKSRELLELAVKTDGLPESHYRVATLGARDFELAARLGFPPACISYANPDFTTDFSESESMSMAKRCHYLDIGARQGHGECINALCRLLFEQESVRDWGRAARLITSDYTGDGVRSSWLQRRRPDVMDPSKVFGVQRLRELYAYGRYFERTTVVGHAPLVAFSRQVRNAAARSTVTLLGVLRRRLRCPKDIALMLARPLWESRELRTEVWRPTGPLSGPEQFVMRNDLRTK